MKLNLGCWKTPMEGWINVDVRQPADVVHDLNVFPWPWADGSADEIRSISTWEHLDSPIRALREAHRVLKVGGVLTIGVPHMKGVYATCHEHKHYFARSWFSLVAEGTDQTADIAEKQWQETNYRVELASGCPLPILDWVASRWAMKWEKWGFVAPDNIYWTARKI